MVEQTGYLGVDGFGMRTIMPTEMVARLENKSPGWLQTKLNAKSAWINAKLWKRYAVPFVSPYPEIILDWLAALVTPEAYAKIGFNPSSEQDKSSILEPADQARDEIDEAADAEKGKFELPLRQDTTAPGISRGAPFVYSEQSPYVWADRQSLAARGEDGRRNGSR
jgi:hypothetical protein